MSIVTTFPFDNTANYTKVSTEVSSGAGRLALASKPSQLFTQDFANDIGFTYDNAKAEFVAGILQQKDQRPVNSLMYTPFTSDANPVWGHATTGNLSGGAVVSGGKLDLTGQTTKQYTHNNLNNWASFGNGGQTGWIEFDLTVNWPTGNPPIAQQVMEASGSGNKNLFFIRIDVSGRITVELRDNAGANSTIIVTSTLTWTNGQTYKIAVAYDTTSSTRIFRDGVQITSLGTSGLTTDNNNKGTVYWCRSGGGDLFLDNILWMDTPRFTADYAVPANPPETIYVESKIDIPDFMYSLLGTIQTLDSLAITENGSPRYTFEGQYWNGSAWVASNGSYLQAIDKATANTNLPTLDMTGQTIVSLQIIFQNADLQSNVDDLILTYTGQEYPLEGSLLTNNAFIAQNISGFSPTEVKPVNTAILYAIEVGSVNMYWSGTAWVTSDGTSTQANTLADIIANIGTLLSANSSVKILIILTTTDQDVSTSEIDLINVTYDFGALAPTDPTQCQVYGFLKDSENQPIVGATVSATPNRADDEYKEASNRLIAKTIAKTTDANGFFSMNLIISDDFEVGAAQKMRYVLSIAVVGQTLPVFKNGTLSQILFEVPNLASVNITDQIGAV